VHGLSWEAILAEQQVKTKVSGVTSLNKLIDMLFRLKVINEAKWLQAHELKWSLLGKPEWIKR
jgi:hypothetical protein